MHGVKLFLYGLIAVFHAFLHLGIVRCRYGAGAFPVVRRGFTEDHAVLPAFRKLRAGDVKAVGCRDFVRILVVRHPHHILSPGDAVHVIVLKSSAFNDLIDHIGPCSVSCVVLVLAEPADIRFSVLQNDGDGHPSAAVAFDGAGAKDGSGLHHIVLFVELIHGEIQRSGFRLAVVQVKGSQRRIGEDDPLLRSEGHSCHPDQSP